MKKILILIVLLILVCAPSLAETYTYSNEAVLAFFFECEDFDREIPASLADAFKDCIEAGDEILCGTVYASKSYGAPDTPIRSASSLCV